MYKESILKGTREEVMLNRHKVTVISTKILIPYEEGREKLRKLIEENK